MVALVKEASLVLSFNTAITALNLHGAVDAVSLPIEALLIQEEESPNQHLDLHVGRGNFRITPTGVCEDPSLHEGG